MGVKRLICAFAILGLVACGAGAGKGPGNKGPIASETNDPGLEGRNRSNNTGGETVPSLVTVYFDYDDSALRPDAKDGLRRNAEYLRQREGRDRLDDGRGPGCDRQRHQHLRMTLADDIVDEVFRRRRQYQTN